MRKTKHTFIATIALSLAMVFGQGAIAQENTAEFISTDKLHNNSDAQNCDFRLVPGKGVLVTYSTVTTKPDFSYGPNLVFYDKNLKKKWELLDYSPGGMKKAAFGMFYGFAMQLQAQMSSSGGKMNISNCYVDPAGNYAYNVNTNKNTINIINIESGKVEKIKLEDKIHLDKMGYPVYSTDAFVDENYFYFVEGNKFLSSSDAKKRPWIFVKRIKHGETKVENFKLTPENPNGSQKTYQKGTGAIRQWQNFLVLDNVLILKDNYTVQDKESKQFFRKMAYYPLDGSKPAEVYVKMGEKIADNDLLGEVMYDAAHKRIFTYSMNKKSGKLVMTYRCFNLKMEPIWEKEFDPQIGKQIIQKIINPATLSVNFDNSITITSRYGKDYYSVHTDTNGDNPEFKKNDKCTQGKLRESGGYTVNCYEYNALQKASGFKSFIMKDKNAKENKTFYDMDLMVVGDMLIFAKGYFRRPGYKLACFKMP